MSPLQITLLIIFVIVVVTLLITYLVRKKYYKQIDELDKQKSEVLNLAPHEELKEMAEMNITGQSLEVRKSLEEEWKEIETVQYPKLENYLYDAEQATDRYRLGESKRNQDAAEKSIAAIKDSIATLKASLTELIEREQANLEQIDEIKKSYHEIRKSLLAYSFSFGTASESFEKKLRAMENDFRDFSDFTVSGDHEEAKAVVLRLDEEITRTEQEMKEVPPLLSKVDEDYAEQLVDLKEGYEGMSGEGYLFPEDTILEDIQSLHLDKDTIHDHIRLLELEEAKEKMTTLEQAIDELYDRMELEYEAKPEVAELLEDSKRGLYYLQDEHRRVIATLKRMAQSYILNHNEEAKIKKLGSQITEAREAYEVIDDRLKNQAIPYSVAYNELYKLFTHLDQLDDGYHKVSEGLEAYRLQELEYKDSLSSMEQRLYSMKRRLENERLPGLPEDYLELFFSTTNRVEQLANELARPKIQLIEIQKLHRNCEDDIKQLSDMTEEMIDQVELLERASQRLYRYKDSHKGVLETIRYSESLFSTDYDYETSLKLVREKLGNVAPGDYEEVEQAYYAEIENLEEN